MQITLDLSLITVPTPEPYLKKQPDRQRENLAYVFLQFIAQVKTSGLTITITKDESDDPSDLTDVVEAIRDLQFNSQLFDLGPLKIILSNRIMGVMNT